MYTPVIAFKTHARNYSGLVNLGNAVCEALSENVWFVEPGVSLPVIRNCVNDVLHAQAKWGPANNRGSHADLVDLRMKAGRLRFYLKAEAQYVQGVALVAAGNDYALMRSIIMSSGFGLRGDNTPQGVLEKVQNFRFVNSRALNRNEVKLKWSRPLNLHSLHNVKSYRVYRGTSPDFLAAVPVATVSKTCFVDVNDTGDVQTFFYWVVPMNYAGPGAISDLLSVTVLAK